MIWPFNKKSQRQLDHERWAEEDRQKQIGRARRIELWASRKLDEAKLGGPHYAVKDQILVSYEELLNIWDTAGRLREDL